MTTRLLLLGEGHCFRDQVLESLPQALRKKNDEHSRPNHYRNPVHWKPYGTWLAPHRH